MNRFRIDVIDALQQIASKSEQIDAHEAAETPINIPAELLKNWKQAYRPESTGFSENFTQAELNPLSRFTDFFVTRLSYLPEPFNELLKDPCWNSICEFADELLGDFEKGSNGEQNATGRGKKSESD